jgi:predicted dehydrogenase
MHRIGIIGTGMISRAYCDTIKAFPGNFKLTAVCNHSDKAKSIVDEFGLKHYWKDYNRFVREAPIDAAIICLPNSLHYDAAKAALNSGKHILVEKPFVTQIQHCDKLIELAEEKNLICMVGQNQRYENELAALKDFIDSGKMGRIHHARIDMLQNLHNYTEPPHWLYDGNLAGGGSVISVAVHFIDLIRYLLGDMKSVIALSKTASADMKNAEDYCCAMFEFENGAIGQMFSTYSAAALPYSASYWIYGDNAVVHAIPPVHVMQDLHPQVAFLNGTQATTVFNPMVITFKKYPTDNTITNEMLHFADCIETNAEPFTSARDNKATMAAIFAIYESAKQNGKKIYL